MGVRSRPAEAAAASPCPVIPDPGARSVTYFRWEVVTHHHSRIIVQSSKQWEAEAGPITIGLPMASPRYWAGPMNAEMALLGAWSSHNHAGNRSQGARGDLIRMRHDEPGGDSQLRAEGI